MAGKQDHAEGKKWRGCVDMGPSWAVQVQEVGGCVWCKENDQVLPQTTYTVFYQALVLLFPRPSELDGSAPSLRLLFTPARSGSFRNQTSSIMRLFI